MKSIKDISILIYDKNNRILFSKRSKNKSLYPSYWTMSTEGHMSRGENTEDTAHRELKEELGIDIELTFLKKVEVNEPPNQYLTSCYIGKYQGEKIVIEPSEIEEIRFLNENEFNQLLETEKATEFAKEFARDFWAGKNNSYL
ncbi:NUDIX domain-containing protein [Candidatus Daviesbacteria bacterium]|nr:NUDIX domain-containing protein [Candidatus Daviesbacteria bacterium]